MFRDKTQFYTHVSAWIEAQVNSCLILLEFIWRLLPRSTSSSSSSSSQMASEAAAPASSTPTRTPREHDAQPTASIFEDLRSPLHGVVLTDTMYDQLESSAEHQHNYLKEFVLIWHESFRIAHQTRHSHTPLLPEMLQKLLKFVELSQRLFIRALQSTVWSSTVTSKPPSPSPSTSPFPSPTPTPIPTTSTSTTTTTNSPEQLLAFLTLEHAGKASQRDVAHRALTAIKSAYDLCIAEESAAQQQVDAHFSKPQHPETNDNTTARPSEERRVRFVEPRDSTDTTSAAAASSTPFSKNLSRADQLLRDTTAPIAIVSEESVGGRGHGGHDANQIDTNNIASSATSTSVTPDGPIDTLHPDDIERAWGLETVLQQRRHESEQCRIKLEKVKRELRTSQVETAKFNEVIEFLNSFQQAVVPEWQRLIAREHELVHRWNALGQTYHTSYSRYRYETAHTNDFEVFRTALDVREQVCIMFRDLFARHLAWNQKLQQLSVQSHRIIAQSRKTMQNLHAQITLALEPVSREITVTDNQLCHVMLQSDIYDIHADEAQMKRVTLTFRQLLIDMTTRAMNSERLRNYQMQLDHMCCHENRLGFGFRVLPPTFLDAHLPTSAMLSSTSLDRVVFDLHQQTEPMSSQVHQERQQLAQRLAQSQQRMPPTHQRPTDL